MTKKIYSDIKFTIKNQRKHFANNDLIIFLRNNNDKDTNLQEQLNILYLNLNNSNKTGLTLINEKMESLNEFITLNDDPVFSGKYNENISNKLIIKTFNKRRLEDNTDRKRRVFKIIKNDTNDIYDIQAAGILPVFKYKNKSYFLMMNEKKYNSTKSEWEWKGYSDFGGKLEYNDQTLFEGAMREFNEETNHKFAGSIPEDRIIDTIICDQYTANTEKSKTKAIIFIIDVGELKDEAVDYFKKYGLFHFIHGTYPPRNYNYCYNFFKIESLLYSFKSGEKTINDHQLHYRLRLHIRHDNDSTGTALPCPKII